MTKPSMLSLAALAALLLAGCGQEPAAPGNAAPAAPAAMPRNKAPEDARVWFIEPQDGATVSSPVTVQFGVSGIALAPAGDARPDSGHHHLLINTGMPALDQPVPKDERHLHFGKAQSEATVELPPGKHTLQMLLGDANHVPHDPPVSSARITITVE